MTAPRSIHQNFSYNRYRKKSKVVGCEFCKIGQGSQQLVAQHKYFNVIKNIFPYSLWDNQKVADHLMIVPKKHTDTLADLTAAEASEYVKLLAEYEKNHYNVYARAPSSSIKTISHQHTHLIKPQGGARKFVFLLRKPFYIRFVF
jgi:diadenosine tetraphosphate (Ap4A) HIT family hydrolase